MIKETYHPKAFLALKKNVRPGLVTRTRVLLFLDGNQTDTKSIAQNTGLKYTTVLYHLRLLETEKILARIGKRPHSWKLTGAGQQRLMSPHDA